MASTSPSSNAASASSSYSAVAISTITLPLTTLFTPPPDCTEPILSATEAQFTYSYDTHFSGHTYPDIFKVQPTCYPSGFDVIFRGYQPVYSPGLCPSGFTVGGEHTFDSTTFATCCPSAAFLGTKAGVYCKSQPAATLTRIHADGETQLVYSKWVLLVPPVTVAWQSSDISLYPAIARALSTSVAATTSSRTSTATRDDVTRTTSSASSATAASSGGGSSLSTGAKAGIGVGVAIGALIIIGLLVWAILERRKRRRGEWTNPGAGSSSGYQSAEPKYRMQHMSSPSEMGSPDPRELEDTQKQIPNR